MSIMVLDAGNSVIKAKIGRRERSEIAAASLSAGLSQKNGAAPSRN